MSSEPSYFLEMGRGSVLNGIDVKYRLLFLSSLQFFSDLLLFRQSEVVNYLNYKVLFDITWKFKHFNDEEIDSVEIESFTVYFAKRF